MRSGISGEHCTLTAKCHKAYRAYKAYTAYSGLARSIGFAQCALPAKSPAQKNGGDGFAVVPVGFTLWRDYARVPLFFLSMNSS